MKNTKIGLPEDLQTGRHGQIGLVGSIGLWVRLTRIFHKNLFFIKINMYLPLGKSCRELLGAKCITLNSTPISRKSLAQVNKLILVQ